MAKLYAEHEGPHGGPHEEHKKRAIWPWLLLLALVAIPLLWSQMRGQAPQTAYFKPGTEAVIQYQGHDWIPVPNAEANQVTFPANEMTVVGQDDGYNLYANVQTGAEGGGGGPVTPGQTPEQAMDRIYLRTGENTYVPLMWKK